MIDADGQPIHFALTRTTDAVEEWVTLAQAKQYLKVDSSDEDDTIAALAMASRQKVETDTRRAGLSQTWLLSLDAVPASRAPILFPASPVLSVTSVTSYDTANASSVVATSVYRLDSSSTPARLVLKDGQDWPSGLRPQNAIEIVFVGGYATSADGVPEELRQAQRLLMSHWHANREAVQVSNGLVAATVPLAYEALVAPYKVAWL